MRLMRKVPFTPKFFFLSLFSASTVVTCDQVGSLHIHFFWTHTLFLNSLFLSLNMCYVDVGDLFAERNWSRAEVRCLLANCGWGHREAKCFVHCIYSLLAFTEKGKWELILSELILLNFGLERNKQVLGVLLGLLLDVARSIKENALVLGFGGTTS